MRAQLKPAIIMLALLTLITGVIYPLVVTVIAQVAFPAQANGSLIVKDGQADRLELDRPVVRRSQVLLGTTLGDGHVSVQRFNAEALTASSGSNYGPLNPALLEMVQGAHRCAARRPIPITPNRSRSIW